MSDSLLPSLRACQDPLWQSLNNTMKPFVHPQLTHTITRVSVPLCFIVWLVYFTSWNINIVQGTTCPRVECFHQSKFWVGIFKSQSYTSKVSTTGVSDKSRQWSDLGAKTPNMAPFSWIDLQGYPLSSSGFAGRSRKGELWRMSTSIGALDVQWPQSSPLPSSVSSWLSAKTWNWIAQVHWFGATRGQFIKNV